jgi:DNA polymerase
MPRNLADLARVALHVKMDKQIRSDMKGVQYDSLDDATQQKVSDYCLTDSINTKKLVELLPAPGDLEADLAEHTRHLNRQGIHVDTEKMDRDRQHLEMLRHTAMHSIPWVEDGGKPLSYLRFADWCKRQNVVPPESLDKRDADCNAWIIANPGAAHALKDMRLFRGSNAKLEKLKLILANADENGRIGLDLIYCGARHTRRWSAKNINVQNLDSKPVFQDEMAALPWFQEQEARNFGLTSADPGFEYVAPGIFMREYFLPPPGKKFGIIDYSQIEPRCLAWLVRNVDLLAAVRAGYGIYEAHAKATMQWNGQPGTLKSSDPSKYKFAKERVLSLGYGMGHKAFRDKAALVGITLSEKEAKAQVADFRSTNRKVVGLWKMYDKLIQACAHEEVKTLELEMPTGDKLIQFSVRCKLNGGYESYSTKGDFGQQSHQPRLWGGTLTENVCQRMARDILAESLLVLERAGLPVVFHAHDEVILALDASSAESDFAEAVRLMSIPPAWCADLPLAVDGSLHDHYTKLT